MIMGGFYSIVQLGVGIHAGTAILQLAGEFGIAPAERRVENIKNWLSQEKERGNLLPDQWDDLMIVLTKLRIFKVQYGKLYFHNVVFNFSAGAMLTLLLSVMSFLSKQSIGYAGGLIIVLLCFCPALFSFCLLSHQIRNALLPIEAMISEIENSAQVVGTKDWLAPP